MKLIYFFALLLFFPCLGFAQQKVQPVQIQTIDTSTYVVNYVPLADAQAGVDAQLTQVNKQIETIDKHIAEDVKKRDVLMQQKAALELIQKQLAQAATTPPPPNTQSATPASAETPKKKKN